MRELTEIQLMIESVMKNSSPTDRPEMLGRSVQKIAALLWVVEPELSWFDSRSKAKQLLLEFFERKIEDGRFISNYVTFGEDQ